MKRSLRRPIMRWTWKRRFCNIMTNTRRIQRLHNSGQDGINIESGAESLLPGGQSFYCSQKTTANCQNLLPKHSVGSTYIYFSPYHLIVK